MYDWFANGGMFSFMTIVFVLIVLFAVAVLVTALALIAAAVVDFGAHRPWGRGGGSSL